jgi:uncharacterized protein YdaU (DUF1376 family)
VKPNYLGKAPLHQKWSERDFLADTTHMSWLARMFYARLLQSAPHFTTRPDLPDDDDQLRKILGGVPKDVWNEHRDVVRAMFTADTVNGINVLWQKRLREDWQGVEAYRKQQSDLAKRKWAKRDAEAMPRQSEGTLSPCLGTAMVMPRQSEGNANLCQVEEEGEGIGISLVNSIEPAKSNGQDIERLSGLCYTLTRKTPNPVDVRKLLDDYRVAELESALREYVDGIEDRELPYVELSFFAQGGAVGVIHARRIRAEGKS